MKGDKDYFGGTMNETKKAKLKTNGGLLRLLSFPTSSTILLIHEVNEINQARNDLHKEFRMVKPKGLTILTKSFR